VRCIDIEEPGGPEALKLTEIEVPVAGPGQVLIRVAAAGVNRADTVQRMGFYPPPPGASPIPGLEVAGEIVELGQDVTGWRIGDQVCALLTGGGYAEYAVAMAQECLPVPGQMSLTEAAGLPETVLTVWSNVMQRCALKPGEHFLVHGGASGIGTTAIQLARELGARVYATAGTPEKVAFCEELGATRCVNYRDEDFVETLRDATGGHGIDVTLDMVGGDYTDRNIQLAAVEGRIVNIAFLKGSSVTANLMPVMLKRLVITGSTLRAREADFKAALTAEVAERCWPWVASGAVKPIVHATLPLAEAAEAHRMMEASEHIGKIILTMESP
jgi:NADPH2:quinone reductase